MTGEDPAWKTRSSSGAATSSIGMPSRPPMSTSWRDTFATRSTGSRHPASRLMKRSSSPSRGWAGSTTCRANSRESTRIGCGSSSSWATTRPSHRAGTASSSPWRWRVAAALAVKVPGALRHHASAAPRRSTRSISPSSSFRSSPRSSSCAAARGSRRSSPSRCPSSPRPSLLNVYPFALDGATMPLAALHAASPCGS